MDTKQLISMTTVAAFALTALVACEPQTGPDGTDGDESGDVTTPEEEHGHAHGPEAGEDEQPVRVAVAEMNPTEGNDVRGTITFTRVEEGIQVVAELEGFDEAGPRGFHIHEHGDCSAPDATSAGGHFDPFDHDHAGPEDDERHVGDLGNIEVSEDGTAHYERVDTHLSFDGEASIIGRSVVVHAEEDDLESQPTGDAGGRVSCGVIQVLEYDEE